MLESLSSSVAHSLSLVLLHFVWQGLLIGLLYGMLLTVTDERSARVRYATSLTALTAMALCPIVTFVLLHNPGTLVDAVPQHIAASPPSSSASHTTATPLPQPSQARSRDATSPAAAWRATNNEVVGRDKVRWVHAILNSSQPYVLLLWLAGVILSGARLTAGFLNVLWLRSGRASVPAELVRRSLMLADHLSLKTARVFTSERIREAAVVGFLRPVVLLPAAWLTELPPDVLEAVIAHELAHIRRFDVWVNLLQRLVETLLFYHPMVWWLSNRIRLERELCCDELAVQATGNRSNYVLALEQVGRLQLQGTLRLAPTFTGGGKMKLLSRIQHVLGTDCKPDREPSWLVGVAAVFVSLVIAGVVGGAGERNAAVAQDRDRGPFRRSRGRVATLSRSGSRSAAFC